MPPDELFCTAAEDSKDGGGIQARLCEACRRVGVAEISVGNYL